MSVLSRLLTHRAEAVLIKARNAGLMLATAESCTGGLVAASLTDIAGSSDVFERGFVTYSNAAKHDLLGVSADSLADHGAVSKQVAQDMALGALENSLADIAVSITGIAGPGGGSEDKPVGLVYFGLAKRGHRTQTHKRLFGDQGRERIRELSALFALDLFKAAI
ncbi:CinA family protein [Woodsholea maritima]|uniref:CinA family protein n=1 Tax=Woodsholea maritima TaxID=240237 RepID=UPI00037CCD09|nr:CinA family protein [Woodsholea maritima]